jgi:hypothetical protein
MLPTDRPSDAPGPPRDVFAAAAGALRAHGWAPDGEGALSERMLDDVLLILCAQGGAREVALYLQQLDAHEPEAARRTPAQCAAAALAVVRAAGEYA